MVYTVYWTSNYFVLLFSVRYLEVYSKEEEEEEGVRKSKKDVIDLSAGVFNLNPECTHSYQIEWKIWNGNWFNIFKQFFLERSNVYRYFTENVVFEQPK